MSQISENPRSTDAGTPGKRACEAEDVLGAIRAGEVDGVVVDGTGEHQVYLLQSPDEPFRMFVEAMQEGALTVDDRGTIVYCNRSFARLVGRPLNDVCGRLLADFVAAGYWESLAQMLASAAEAGVRGEARLAAANGRAVPVQLAFNRLPAERARMFGVVVTDLTDRERASRLDAQRLAAEEAKSARDHFLAVVTHELRTPLGAILGWAQALQFRPDLPHPVHQGLNIIERNARAQSRLIEDLMDVSRILAGKLRLDPKPTALNDVIETAAASVRPSAENKRVTVRLDLPAARVMVNGDADRLQQVVVNLLSNAVKYSADGDTVSVRVEAAGDVATITVADGGVGISPELLSGLFEPYRQIESSTTLQAGGLGLGLAIVKQLTELHGGQVTAHSDGEGRGALFTVRLPLLAADLEGSFGK